MATTDTILDRSAFTPFTPLTDFKGLRISKQTPSRRAPIVSRLTKQDPANKSRSTVKELFDLGAHKGCKKRYWNPKMSIFIYGERDGTYILDLVKVGLCLSFACNYLKNASRKKKT